jgi:hypothetical protein
MENGENLQRYYREIDKVLSEFHISAEDVTSTPKDDVHYSIATVSFDGIDISIDEVKMLWNIYKCDHPLYYWIDTRYGTNSTYKYLRFYTHKDYIVGSERQKYISEIYEFARDFAERMAGETSAYRISLAAHDYIISLVDYAYDSEGNPQSALWAHSAIGVVTGQGAVCEGYATAMQLLLNVCGVENMVVEGDSGGSHEWNLIRFDDGNWYWCDTTWDDVGEGKIKYNYFGVNDTQFVNWRDESFGNRDSYEGDATFMDSHTPYTMEYEDPGYRIYDLPARSDKTFSSEKTLELRETFTVDGLTYSLIGYEKVQLIYADIDGTVDIPERVIYDGITYTVTAIGAVNQNGYFSTNDSALSDGVTKLIIPMTIDTVWSGSILGVGLTRVIAIKY